MTYGRLTDVLGVKTFANFNHKIKKDKTTQIAQITQITPTHKHTTKRFDLYLSFLKFVMFSLLPFVSFLLWLGLMSRGATAWAPPSSSSLSPPPPSSSPFMTTMMKSQYNAVSRTATSTTLFENAMDNADNSEELDDDDDDVEISQQSDSGSNERSEAQRYQEMIFEDMSSKGANVIAKMDIPERTKRALLAETIEDRIFELTEILEGIVNDNNGTIPEADRERATDIAKQTKQLQIQYNNLVSGKPSSILDALKSK